jgi:hypothetical protein
VGAHLPDATLYEGSFPVKSAELGHHRLLQHIFAGRRLDADCTAGIQTVAVLSHNRYDHRNLSQIQKSAEQLRVYLKL